MRTGLVLFLMFAINFPFFAQTDKAGTLLTEAAVFIENRTYDKALINLTKAAKIYQQANQDDLRHQVLLKVSEVLLLADENFEARKMANKVLELTAQNDTLAAGAHQFLGNLDLQDGQVGVALRSFQEALDIRKNNLPQDHPAIAESLLAVSQVQNQLRKTNLALENAQAALAILEKVYGKTHPKTAEAIGTLGTIYSTKGEQEKAIPLLQQSIDIFKKLEKEQQLSVAQQYFNLGKAHLKKGSYDLGLMNAQRGLTILENLKGVEHPARAPFLNTIGKIYTLRGDYQQARNFYQQALDLVEFHRGERHPDIADSYVNIAKVLQVQDQPDSALAYLSQSLEMNESLFGEEHPRVAQSLSDIASVHFQKEDYDRALAFYHNANAKFKDFYGTRHTTIAKVEQQIGRIFLKKAGFEVALKHFQNSLNANVPFPYLAIDISENPPLDQVLDKKVFLSTLSLKAQVQTKLYLSKGRYENLEYAYSNFLLCDSLIDDIRRSFIEHNDLVFFNRTASQVYEEAIYSCFILKNHTQEQKYIAKAFYFSEKNKSNALLQSFAHEEALKFADLPKPLKAQEADLQFNIDFYQKELMLAVQYKDSALTVTAQQQLLDAKKAYHQFVLDLEMNYPHYYQLKYDKTVVTLAGIQSTLDDETIFLEFMSGEKRLFIFSISKEAAFFDFINKGQGYDQQMSDFRKSFSEISYITQGDSLQTAWDTYTTYAHEFYKLWLEPAFNHFEETQFEKIIIVPDGKLGYIPFEILLQAKPDFNGINYATLNYVLKNFSVSYAFSGTMLIEQQSETQQQEQKELRYGGFAPIYASGRLSLAGASSNFNYIRKGKYIDLPASRKGVEYIAQLLDGAAFTNESATETTFRDTSKSFDILHLAMHGVYDDKNPLNSHLVFAQVEDNSNNDNFLTAGELYNLNMDASLVFLGACNSGYGQINRGEGIMSLSRSFAYAGCPSIVMSLWSVPDDETATITNYFFQKLKKGATKDEALREAKLQYLNDSSVPPDRLHPLFWAGFVPIGDMTALYSASIFPFSWKYLA
ncbi:MAG: CHAT domain-containing tetratricopeptide repeat protein, partial [Bacteroidota bacterium]